MSNTPSLPVYYIKKVVKLSYSLSGEEDDIYIAECLKCVRLLCRGSGLNLTYDEVEIQKEAEAVQPTQSNMPDLDQDPPRPRQ